VAIAIASGFVGQYEPDAAPMVLGCAMLIFMPVLLILYFFTPAALMATMITGRISAGFQFGELYALIRRNLMNYILAIVIYILANMIGQFGVIVFCIGVLFTAFWSLVITTYAMAEVFRLDRGR
jgi:hypothetical protein